MFRGWVTFARYTMKRTRDTGASLPGIARVAALGAALVLTAGYAYYVAFSTFPFYDDEGFLDLSLRHFMQGRPLYDDVFTQYGPFYYLFNAAVFQGAGVPVDNDSMRLVVIGLWLTCAASAALCTLRLTGTVMLACAALALTGLLLGVLANEPGHPQALSILLVMLLPTTAACFSPRRRAVVCASLGAIVGCLLMTKLNVGVFALLAVTLVMSASIAGPFARAMRLATSAAIVVLPTVLMRLHLHLPWVRSYALVATLAALPVVWSVSTSRFLPALRLRDAAWAAAACAAALVVSSLGVVAHGTSLRAAVLGPLEQALKFPSVFQVPAPVDSGAVAWAAASLVLFGAVQVARRRRATGRPLDLVLAGLKLGFGTYVLYAAYGVSGVFYAPMGAYYFNVMPLFRVALPFVWMLMVPSSATPIDATRGFGRAVLCTVAVLNSLQAYPVAGSQLSLATVLVILVGAVCLHDGLTGIALLLPPWAIRKPLRMAVTALAVSLVLLAQWSAARTVRQRYDAMVRLDLPGARRVRMPEESVALYRWLSTNLQAHTDTFIGMPAINSLYFWSEKDPPTSVNPNAWMLLLDDAAQEHIVRALSTHPNAGAVVSYSLLSIYMHPRGVDDQPLARYVDGEFQTLGRFRGFELRIRKDRPVPEMLYAARRRADDGSSSVWLADMALPAMKGRAVHRITVVDPKSRRVLADTRPGSGVSRLAVTDTDGEVTAVGLDLAIPAHLRLVVASPLAALKSDGLLVRLLDERNQVFASVPVL